MTRETAPTLPELTLDVWQQVAVALCEHACGGELGRDKLDLVYREVTENRDGPGPEQRKRYSSCGDQAHWLYKRLGIREPWCNRTDDGVFGPFEYGVNVSRLWGGANPLDQVPPSDLSWRPGPGDVLIIWNSPKGTDAHVCVCLGPGPDDGHLRIANYGAGGMSAATKPGANITLPAFWRENGFWVLGHRRIQRWLPLADAVKHISVKPDLSGASLVGEVIDAVELGWEAYVGR